MKIFRKLSVIISCLLFALCSLLMGLELSGKIKQTEAVSTTDTTSYVKVDEIWNGSKFVRNNVNKLLQLIAGSSSTNVSNMSTIETMASSTTSDGQPGTSAATLRAKTYGKTSSQDVVVRFGGLDWQVMYLSNDKSGNPILTLWLSNSTQSAFSGRSTTEGAYYGFRNGGLYSLWAANWSDYYFTSTYPANMYGSSYINAVTLNNGGNYATGVSSISYSSQSSTSAFAKFTMSSVNENVTKYLVKPNQVPWQLNQDSTLQLGYYTDYNMPNENAGPLSSYNWLTNSSWGSASSMLSGSSSSYYYTWANNYLWLPSVSEIGYTSSKDGIWQTSEVQRNNGNSVSSPGSVGSTSKSAGLASWTRTGYYDYASHSCNISSEGKYCDVYGVNGTACAVRPALHLNLNLVKRAAGKTYTIVQNYNGGLYNGSTSTSQSNVYENDEFSFNVPIREGYTLTGWTCTQNSTTYKTAADGSFTFYALPDLGDSTTINFTAQWEKNKYTLIADANGGSISSTSTWTGTGALAYKKVNFEDTYSTLPTVSRSGYRLTGWYTTANSGGTLVSSSITANGSNFASSSSTVMDATGTKTIYARWTNQSYTITFNSNDGTNQTKTQNVTYNGYVTLSPNTFTREGYTFAGWSTSALGGYIAYIDGQSINFTNTSNLTLYAVWKEDLTGIVAPVLKDGAYQIASAGNLAWLARESQTRTLTGTYVQTASIDLLGKNWTPIGNATYPFSGTYDGQGFPISNLYVMGNLSYRGLFGYCRNATISNVRLASGKISGSDNVGGIAGYAEFGVITNCVNFCNISGTSVNVGGIVGQSSSVIDKCYNYGDVFGNYYVGGIVGYYLGTSISNSIVKSTISLQSTPPYVGGIVGYAICSSLRISASYFEGTLYSVYNYGGALVGYCSGARGGQAAITFVDCYAKTTFPTITSFSNNGLIAGFYGTLSIENCIMEIDGQKWYKGSDFSNWVITLNNLPLPKPLAWLGKVGDQLSTEVLDSLNYSLGS